jgi:hypothetical protein
MFFGEAKWKMEWDETAQSVVIENLPPDMEIPEENYE